jgi:hypothetical protein
MQNCSLVHPLDSPWKEYEMRKGLEPNTTRCIGFGVPLIFAESGSPDTPYVADLNEHVSYVGDLKSPNRRATRRSKGASRDCTEAVTLLVVA